MTEGKQSKDRKQCPGSVFVRWERALVMGTTDMTLEPEGNASCCILDDKES